MLWNKSGSVVLVLAFTDFDVTNQSYYGEQKLHYLPSDPSKSDKAGTVDLTEGPVHDVQVWGGGWSTSRKGQCTTSRCRGQVASVKHAK
jgi:uncharacterized protein with WD repeat